MNVCGFRVFYSIDIHQRKRKFIDVSETTGRRSLSVTYRDGYVEHLPGERCVGERTWLLLGNGQSHLRIRPEGLNLQNSLNQAPEVGQEPLVGSQGRSHKLMICRGEGYATLEDSSLPVAERFVEVFPRRVSVLHTVSTCIGTASVAFHVSQRLF